ncbi:TIGR02597 family protein [Prosthecobacter sp. SYSU 5D2]|uniref:TIGR02597 family protein n=1 Tax=Prosthecobacter sp. SYSU 5D2 TaxID=3134134 RepID=UPI0031FEC835
MKQFILTLLTALALLTTASAQKFRTAQGTTGSQYVYVPANTTVIVAPQFQRPSVGIFKVTSTATSGSTTTLDLAGKPALDSYTAPLLTDQYEPGANTYYAMVTAGHWAGLYFTVTGNTPSSLALRTDGLVSRKGSIRTVEVRPYWNLETLFPTSAATVSFIPTTSADSIKTKLVIAPLTFAANEQPQQVGESYYYSSSLSAWVNSKDPLTPAGKDLVAPTRSLYLQSTHDGSYPLDAIIAGTVLTSTLQITFASSPTEITMNCFALPRSSDYKLSKMGFTNKNFTPSLNHSPLGHNDLLLVDNGFGKVGATYYRYKNKWYMMGSSLAVDPIIPAGSAFVVKKAISVKKTDVMYNLNNVR